MDLRTTPFEDEQDPRQLLEDADRTRILERREGNYDTQSVYRLETGGNVEYIAEVDHHAPEDKHRTRTLVHFGGEEQSHLDIARQETNYDQHGWHESDVEFKRIHWTELVDGLEAELPEAVTKYMIRGGKKAREDEEQLGDYIGQEFGENYNSESFQLSREGVNALDRMEI